jgi:TetR/AcrR family transcriptional regulator, transcriptional repressor for nem operon
LVRYKPGHRARTQDSVIEAAARLLRERGFAQTGVADVMREAGLTHGGFYAHFPDKGAMLAAALDRALAASPGNFATLGRMAAEAGDPGLIAQHYLADRRVADAAQGCAAAALSSEVPRQAAPVRAAFQAGAEATVEALAGASGGTAPLPWATLAMLAGALAMMRAIDDPARQSAIRDEVIEALRRLHRPPDPTPP